MEEGTTLTLAAKCKEFLLDTNYSVDVRRFACEALSYLSLGMFYQKTVKKSTEWYHEFV
jgi:hypothetical protein